jgi:hypothetical protein
MKNNTAASIFVQVVLLISNRTRRGVLWDEAYGSSMVFLDLLLATFQKAYNAIMEQDLYQECLSFISTTLANVD